MEQRKLIIIPAFNEEASITKVIEDVRASDNACEFVVINDGSQDKTAQIAREMQANIISHPINMGAGVAVQTGLRYAMYNDYELAVIIDGDGQHDPCEIRKLLITFQDSQADVVIGSRFLNGQYNGIPWARRFGIRLFAMIVTFLGRRRITDTTSGYRLYGRRAIAYLSQEIPVDFPDADMILSLLFSGFKLSEVPVSIRPRLGGQSMYSVLRSIYYPFKVLIATVAVFLRKLITKIIGGI